MGLNSRSLEILETSGVAERLLATGRRIGRVDFWVKEGLAGSVDLTRLRHRYNYLLMLPQDATESILAQRLLQFGVTVERPVVARSAVDLGGAVSAVLDEGFRKTVELFSAVIGANGTDSMIRHAAGIPFHAFEYENYWGVAEYEVANWPYDFDSLSIFLNARGQFGMAAGVAADRYRFVANAPKPRFQVPGSYNVRRTLSEVSFSVRVGQSDHCQAHNQIFLAGDAAHVHAPIGGRGMNLGIEDAAVLAQLFEEDRLERYTALRRPIATAAIHGTYRRTALTSHAHPAFRGVL